MPDCSDSNALDQQHIAAAVRVLRRGGLAIYPTETLYALGADALNPAALRRLAEVKGREPGKPIAVLISDHTMLEQLAVECSPQARALMRRFWPGPLTLVLCVRDGVSPLLTAGSGIGVRLSSHPVATALVHALARPVTAPSANPAGMPPPRLIDAARAYFGDRVDYYLDGGRLPGEPASTVVDVRDGLTILRAGAIPTEALRATVSNEVATW